MIRKFSSETERFWKAAVLQNPFIHGEFFFALVEVCRKIAEGSFLLADELKEHLIGEHAIDRIFTLGNSEFPVSWDNEVKLWTFLEARASLLLKTYKTTVAVRLL